MPMKVGDPCPSPDCTGKIVKQKESIKDDTPASYDAPASSRLMKVWRCSEGHDVYE
jgi:hypothetical protein